MKNVLHIVTVGLLSCAVVGLIGCERQATKASERSAGAAPLPAAALPSDIFVDEAPAEARSVADVKADTSATGDVVIHGRIGGRAKPFVDGAAVFLLADASMKTCTERHGDSCRTPWDYCCEPRESLAAKTATVQILGPDGKPLRVGLEGTHPLETLARLTIAGEIASRADGGTLVINARKIHVSTEEG